MLNAKKIIMEGTHPSTGCTEPVAVAWACALAAQAVGGKVEEVFVSVDANVYKNAIAVGIPSSGGRYGLEVAAGLGSLGDPTRMFQILEKVSENSRKEMLKLIDSKKIKIHLNEDAKELRIEAKIKTEKGTGCSLIEKYHTNLTELKVNDQKIAFPHYCCSDKCSSSKKESLVGSVTVKELIRLADEIDEELEQWLWKGIEMNMEIARQGLEENFGLCVGKKIQQLVKQGLLGDDSANYASYMTASAVDARMSGANFPVMTNAGSGNQGLGTIVPVMSFAAFHKITDSQKILKAIAVAHLISIYVKEHTGVLSYLCGCAHGATAGAAAGVLTLAGYDAHTIEKAMQNITADVTGMICDGGKPGCALKLALSAGEAVRIALLATIGLEAQARDGIVGASAEDSFANIAQISQKCAKTADQTIVHILDELHKKKHCE
ncbi:MAG: serine dehydratase subunit alpha family protein [Candidatus Brocadiae bacterium]|nr:serine dehydratase subunit alpha family protein [Candidatus Brocadiia bacterium]